ncbi:hypothetical protein ABB07_19490 [Streptomyces incarnatus]|uniref:Aromatic ring-opening dioxygenase LigA n=1 Tax=Streptomyces incarnatus TaxID=665007 RepID=A0ABM5TMG8_9ACTN|nr:hypothetical protein [Streptomyces incarnatus]AKJ12142.1 hypothetical protein ABB07_19490 [Streptomyces incarnatus]
MREPDSRKLRLFALVGAVTAAVVLPLAVASAGQVGGSVRHTVAGKARDVVRAAADEAAAGRALASHQGAGSEPGSGRGEGGSRRKDGGSGQGDAGSGHGDAGVGREDAKLPSLDGSPRLLGLGLATAARCGAQLTSPDGIEAQTCVLAQGSDTWARTYYRNSTGEGLDAVLSLMGPGGHSVQMHCVTGGDDEPATCETPRERSRGGMDAYTAVTEFARRGADGPLLLRSSSDSAGGDGKYGTDNGS